MVAFSQHVALPRLGGGRLTSAWRVGVFPWFELFFKLARVCHHGGDGGLLDVSSARLSALLRLHLHPIDVVVFHAPIGRTHLGRDLALRCFQRLFLPHLATRPCS